MPVKTTMSILGIEVTKDTPTVQEWVAKWGEESIRLEATNNVCYRGTNAEARDLFLHGSEAVAAVDGKPAVPARKGFDDLTGIERQTKKVTSTGKDKTKTFEVWDESEAKYFNRALATLHTQGKYPSVDAARAAFVPLMQECYNLVEFDASKAAPTERKAKGLPAAIVAYIKTVFEKHNEQKLAKILVKSLGHPVGAIVEGKFTITEEELGKAVKEDQDAQAAKRQAELAAMVG